jgi:hypothetical protein
VKCDLSNAFGHILGFKDDAKMSLLSDENAKICRKCYKYKALA